MKQWTLEEENKRKFSVLDDILIINILNKKITVQDSTLFDC